MNIVEATQAAADVFSEATLVPSLGTATSAVRQVTDDGPHFYFGGAMGSALAAALGLAEAVPHRHVVALLGDGEFLMGVSSLWSVSAVRPTNLAIVVLVDGAYSITGGQTIGVPLRAAEVSHVLDGLSGAVAKTTDALSVKLILGRRSSRNCWLEGVKETGFS